jgi:hypothetical protein
MRLACCGFLTKPNRTVAAGAVQRYVEIATKSQPTENVAVIRIVKAMIGFLAIQASSRSYNIRG